MQKSFVPKETLDLQRRGKSQLFPLKHAIVSDASSLPAPMPKNLASMPKNLATADFTSPYQQRALQAEALAREIEAGHRIRYTPGETLVTEKLLSPLQTQARIADIEREYFPEKQAFLEERVKKVEHTRPHSRGSLSEFNAFHLPSEGFENASEFLAAPSSSTHHKSLLSSIQHWPSKSNDSGTKPKLLLELERSLQSGLQLPQVGSADFNMHALALHSDVFDRYIQHTGTYRGLLASIKDMYDQAVTFMLQKVHRFSHAYESLQFFESRIEVVLDKIISEYRAKLRQKDDLLSQKDERIKVLEHDLNVLQAKSVSQSQQFEALTQQKNKFERALAESLKYNDSTTHRMLDLQGRCEDVALIRNRARRSEDLCKNAIMDRDECRSALEEFRALPARIKMLEREKDALQTKLSLQEADSKTTANDSIIRVELFKDTGLPFKVSSLRSTDGQVVSVSEILQLFANSKDLKFIGGSTVPNTDGSGYLLQLHSKTLTEDTGALTEKRLLNVLAMIDRANVVEENASDEVELEFRCLPSNDPATPDYLQGAGDIQFVKNLMWDKGNVERMIDDFWLQRKSDGSGLPLGQFVVKYFRNKHPMSVEMQVTARYNFIKCLALFIYDADFEMLKSCLEGRIIEEVVIAQKDFLISVITNCNRFIDANCQGLKAIEKAEFFKIIRKVCPTKSDKDMKLLKDAMDQAQPGAYVQTTNLFASNEDGDQSEFAEALRDQFLEERIRYLNLIESSLENMCAASRSAVVSAADIKTMFGNVDPNKPIIDVRALIQKGFGTIRDVTSSQTISPAAYVNNLRQTMCSTSTKWS